MASHANWQHVRTNATDMAAVCRWAPVNASRDLVVLIAPTTIVVPTIAERRQDTGSASTAGAIACKGSAVAIVSDARVLRVLMIVCVLQALACAEKDKPVLIAQAAVSMNVLSTANALQPALAYALLAGEDRIARWLCRG
mmetsp:Transcript_67736/g.185746  ORF Transcript_67736/g.185746 Transcript_67736/m.185746 type:complete len:140 (-) Transcript_67736:262-681(-)